MTLLITAVIWGLGITGVLIAIIVSIVRGVRRSSGTATTPISFLALLIHKGWIIVYCLVGLAASALAYWMLALRPILFAVRYLTA